jgi:hypothetical protein
MYVPKLNDQVTLISVRTPTTAVVTQIDDVPVSPDTGLPRVEICIDDGGARQYWETQDLKLV